MLSFGPVQLMRQQQQVLALPKIEIKPGEVLTLMGASGSGKSTLLSWLIGDLAPVFSCAGQIFLNGREVTHLPIEQRRIGLRFQQPMLFPHLSVLNNMLFALPRQHQHTSAQATDHALDFLAAFGLASLAQAKPATLSGGEAARVALARALINQPAAMLLDEPYSALDQTTREQVRTWTFEHLANQQIPTLLVTHDAADAPGRLIRIDDV